MSVAPAFSGTTEFAKVAQVTRPKHPTDTQIEQAYHVEQLAQHIIEHNYRAVALQFPDDLIPDSAQVYRLLESHLGQTDARIYILADTSYSPCCVDEVAARHVGADFVIHFGNACLNPVQSFPVAYVLTSGVQTAPVNKLEALFRSTYTTGDKVLLISDAHLSFELEQLYDRVKDDFQVELTHVSTADALVLGASATPNRDGGTEETVEMPGILRRQRPIELSEYSAMLLTTLEPSSSLVLHLTTLVSSVHLLQTGPGGPIMTQPRTALQKRYRLVNMARSAGTIGILINTLSLRGTTEIVKSVKRWIISAGKKHYTFVVGKPNVPKLANFDAIDIWVVLGCPLGGLMVNSEEFYKPIITPYELNLALQKELMWTGQWIIDFEASLKLADPVTSDADDDDDEPHFDPVTGRYVSNSRPLRRLQHIDIEPDRDPEAKSDESVGQLVSRMKTDLVLRSTVSTAAEHLQTKLSWTGLGSDLGEPDENGAAVEKGRAGIARGYQVEDEERT